MRPQPGLPGGWNEQRQRRARHTLALSKLSLNVWLLHRTRHAAPALHFPAANHQAQAAVRRLRLREAEERGGAKRWEDTATWWPPRHMHGREQRRIYSLAGFIKPPQTPALRWAPRVAEDGAGMPSTAQHEGHLRGHMHGAWGPLERARRASRGRGHSHLESRFGA